jgi:acyl carrier protein
MMTVEELKQKTKDIVSELLPDVGNEEITDDTDIFGLGLDSINAMTLVSNLQDTFDIKLETNEFNFENFQDIANIVEMLRRKKGL